MKQKVFITGITGMVGSHLADYISNNTDWEIHGLCRWRSPLINLENHIENINNGKNFFLHLKRLLFFVHQSQYTKINREWPLSKKLFNNFF